MGCELIGTLRPALAAALALAALTNEGRAAVSADAAAALLGPLTPMGAERAGSADGLIPAWTGTESAIVDEPAETITGATLGSFKDALPEGQKALFAKFPAYRMKLYPTRRTARAPAWVYENTFLNATRARPAAAGLAFGIEGAVGGIPFPIPQGGGEIVWNHLLAFWGGARDDHARTYLVPADGGLELTNRYREIVDFPYYAAGATSESFGAFYFKRREVSDAPPDLAGRGYIAWQPIDSARDQARFWQYLPGQGRVRRAPALGWDTPTPDGAGIESFDEYYIFSGPPDRYRFTLLGKRAMIVPYNDGTFQTRPIQGLATRDYPDPDSLRFEWHRVWVVDAELRPGQHHLAPHRRLYFDEDTWLAVYADTWDAEGRLWKFSEATMMSVPELPAVVQGCQVIFDLQNGGYVLTRVQNGEPEGFHPTGPHPDSLFAPESLAAENRP
jgi:hypothetical protein